MGNFRQNNRSGGGGRSRDFGGGRPQMHSAVCDDCGNDCEVPFKPTGDKPVFCSDCFKGKGNAEPRRFDGRSSGRSNFGDKRMHQAICDKCGKKCEVPFKPTGNKPIYCSDCFGQEDKGKGSNQSSKQFEMINTKLDKILKALGESIPMEVDEKKGIVVVSAKGGPAFGGKPKKAVVSKEKAIAKPKKAAKSKAAPKKEKAKKKK